MRPVIEHGYDLSRNGLCVRDVTSGRGFDGDPDVLLASRFVDAGPNGVEPGPSRQGRLATVLVGDSVARWKNEGDRRRAPSARTLTFYHEFIP